MDPSSDNRNPVRNDRLRDRIESLMLLLFEGPLRDATIRAHYAGREANMQGCVE